MIKALISNGHFKFFLSTAAAEAYKRGALEGLITGGYPTRLIKKIISLSLFKKSVYAGRLSARQESIQDDLVKCDWISELLVQLALFLQNRGRMKGTSTALFRLGFWVYCSRAARVVETSTVNIYHYRSGYGLQSVKIAKRKGMLVICDHSIAHPSILQYLIDNNGMMPVGDDARKIEGIWLDIKRDIDQADHVLVNSGFVKETFLNQGWLSENVSVIYSGLDNQFLVETQKINLERDISMPIKFLFAGNFNRRKGCEILVDAFKHLEDEIWSLEIIGHIEPIYKKKFHTFFLDKRVSCIDFLTRSALAKQMSMADIFVFPSLAEGSARVIFEAMACGCYVITTPNSGSIVENGVHGTLVSPGSIEQLVLALKNVLKMDRNLMKSIGKKNSILVKNSYNQKIYGDSLVSLYAMLLDNFNKKNLSR